MVDVTGVQKAIQASQNGAAAARNRASELRGQLSELRAELARLEQELADLNAFKGRAARDNEEMRGQLRDRQHILDQIGALENVRMAAQLCERMSRDKMASAANALGEGFAKVFGEIDRRRKALEARIADLRRRISMVQQQISEQQALASRYDQQARDASRTLERMQSEAG